MARPTDSMADAAPRAAPRRTSSCFTDRGLGAADRARAASGVLKRSRWHSGLEYVIRVMPGELSVATAEANRSQVSSAGGLGGDGPAASVMLGDSYSASVPYNGKCLHRSTMSLLCSTAGLEEAMMWESISQCESDA